MHILNLEHSLKRFKRLKTARFRKRSANKYKELNIVFIIFFTFEYSIKNGPKQFKQFSNTTNLQETDELQNIQNFLCPKPVYMLLNKTTFWGMGIFFAF